MREEGALDAAVGVAVASGEVPPAVREAADVEVAGPAGALAVLRHLARLSRARPPQAGGAAGGELLPAPGVGRRPGRAPGRRATRTPKRM